MFTEQIIETDILIIGGGISGARAAVEAAGMGADVTLITKGIFGSGTSVGPSVCAGVGPWAVAQDSKELHFKAFVINGCRFLCDQELAKILVDEAPDRLIELEDFGHLWDRDENGDIKLLPRFTEEMPLPDEVPDYYQNRYISSIRDKTIFSHTGRNVLDILRAETRRRGVRVLEETAAVRLLTGQGQVIGAVALDYLHGRWLIIRAQSTIMSTGSISQLWYPWGLAGREITGDGIAMAYREGAIIRDLELIMASYLPIAAPSWSGQVRLLQGHIEVAPNYRPEYQIRWINASGEEFLPNYPPEAPRTTEEFYLKVIRAVQTELDAGRGPLYMDYRSLPREFLAEVAPWLLSMLEKLGRQEGDYLLEVGPKPMWSFGGIKINGRCESSLPGLYACADVACGTKDGFGGSVACGVTTCLVFGARAGRFAGERADSMRRLPVDETEVEEVKSRARVWWERTDGVAPLRLKNGIGQTMRRHMHLKSETTMLQALDELMRIRMEMLPAMTVKSRSRHYNSELVEAFEVVNMLEVAQMLVQASLLRKESRRNMFLREDFPHRDDQNWLKHIDIHKVDGEMQLTTAPVALTYLKPDSADP